MKESAIKDILQKVKNGTVSIEKAVGVLRTLPFEDLGFARVDHHRSLRQGFPEVIWGEGKTAEQIIGIIKKMYAKETSRACYAG